MVRRGDRKVSFKRTSRTSLIERAQPTLDKFGFGEAKIAAAKPRLRQLEERVLNTSAYHWSISRVSEETAKELAKGFEPTAFRKWCVSRNWAATTISKYEACIATLRSFASASAEITEADFLSLMRILLEFEYSASSLEDYRSAFAAFEKVSKPDRTWITEGRSFRVAFQGLKKFASENAKRPRGPITEDRLRELCENLAPDVVIRYCVAFHAMLRHSEMVEMKIGDIRFFGPDDVRIAVWGGKTTWTVAR